MLNFFLPLPDHSPQDIPAQHASTASQYSMRLQKLAQISVTVMFLLDLLV